PRICFFALHPVAICRSSDFETLTTVDPAVCADESAAPAAMMSIVHATRTIVFTVLLLSAGRSRNTEAIDSCVGPSHRSTTLAVGPRALDLGPAGLCGSRRFTGRAIGVRAATVTSGARRPIVALTAGWRV